VKKPKKQKKKKEGRKTLAHCQKDQALHGGNGTTATLPPTHTHTHSANSWNSWRLIRGGWGGFVILLTICYALTCVHTHWPTRQGGRGKKSLTFPANRTPPPCVCVCVFYCIYMCVREGGRDGGNLPEIKWMSVRMNWFSQGRDFGNQTESLAHPALTQNHFFNLSPKCMCFFWHLNSTCGLKMSKVNSAASTVGPDVWACKSLKSSHSCLMGSFSFELLFYL